MEKSTEMVPAETGAELILTDESITDLVSYMPEHRQMLERIEAFMPEFKRGKSFFGKSQSQFMNDMLTVTQPTPIRRVRQVLAECTRTEQALAEAYSKNKVKRKEISIKRVESLIMRKKSRETVDELESQLLGLKADLLEIEAEELGIQLETTNTYISGAIRKFAAYSTQYNSMLKELGLEGFDEVAFENEEVRYHIMTTFLQGLCAARAHGGMIDEGNHIYISQLGINGGSAQMCLSGYLQCETMLFANIQGNLKKEDFDKLVQVNPIVAELAKNMQEPNNDMVLYFLNQMADKYKDCPGELAKMKGMIPGVDASSALTLGDVRLLDDTTPIR